MGSKEDVLGTERNQVSIPLGKFGFRSQPEGWVQGKCFWRGGPLGKRGPSPEGLERERKEGNQAGPARTLLAPAVVGEHLGTHSGHRATEKQVGA